MTAPRFLRPVTWAALGWLALGPGCAHPGRSAPPGLWSGLRDSGVAERDPLRRGLRRLVHQNDLRGARDDLRRARETLGADQAHLRLAATVGLGLTHLARADFRSALDAFLLVLEEHPREPESLVAALQVRELLHQLPDGHLQVDDRLEALLTSGHSLAPELVRALRQIRKEGALRAGRWKQAASIEEEMGVPPVWRTVHLPVLPALAGFESAHPPEKAPLEGSGPDSIRSVQADDGRLALQSEAGGVQYAESHFRIDGPATDVLLRIDAEVPWSVFVDDVRIHTHASHRASLPRVTRLVFRAGAGWHRLLLKVAMRSPRETLGVELLPLGDNRASSLHAWRGEPQVPGGNRGTRPGPARLLAGQRDRLRLRAGADPADPLSPLLAGFLAWEDGDWIAARQQLQASAERAGAFAFPHYVLGLIALDDPELPEQIDSVRSRERFERAVRLCPDLALARFRLAWLDGLEGKETEALSALEDLEASHPGTFFWPYFRGRVLERLGWEVEADGAYRIALAALPDQPDLLQRLFQRALQHHASTDGLTWAKKREELGQWDLDLVDFWVAREEDEHALALLERMARRHPSRMPVWLTRFDLLVRRDDPAAAAAILEQAARRWPGHPAVLRRQAELLERGGRSRPAQGIRRRLAEARPFDIRARLAAHVAGTLIRSAKQQVAALRLAGDREVDTGALLTAYRSDPIPPQGDAVLVLDKAAIEVAPDGSSLERVHQLVHVQTPEGLERWGEIADVPAGSLVEAIRTIRADGTVHDAEAFPGKSTLSLPALQVGDFVEINYVQGLRRDEDLPGYQARRWYFQAEGTPIFRSVYSVAVPGNMELEIDAHGEVPAPRLETEGRFRVATWEASRVPPVLPEPHAPPLDEHAPFLHVGLGQTWNDYRAGLRFELEEATRPVPDLVRFARETAGNLPDERERLRRVYRAVGTRIRQVGDWSILREPASHVLARREGNRLVLLTALLRSLGYQPDVWLVRTRTDAEVDYRFPVPGVYRHGMISVTLGEGDRRRTVWMDPTERFNAFDTLYPFLQGQRALRVTGPAGATFENLPIPGSDHLTKDIDLELALERDGTLAGKGTERIATAQAATYRRLLTAMSPEQRRQVLQAGLGNYFSGAVLDAFEIVALEDPDRPLELRYRIRVPAFARSRADALVVADGFYPYRLGPSLIARQERRLPLLLGDDTRTRTRIALVLPPGSRAELPRSVKWQAPLSRFSYTVHQDGDRLFLEKSLVVHGGRIPPSQYPGFRDFCKRVDRKDTEEIVIHLGSGQASRPRTGLAE